MYQNIFINVLTAENITLKHCVFLPLLRIKDSGLVVCKQVIVLPVHLLGAHHDLKMARSLCPLKVINYRLIEGLSHTVNE